MSEEKTPSNWQQAITGEWHGYPSLFESDGTHLFLVAFQLHCKTACLSSMLDFTVSSLHFIQVTRSGC